MNNVNIELTVTGNKRLTFGRASDGGVVMRLGAGFLDSERVCLDQGDITALINILQIYLEDEKEEN